MPGENFSAYGGIPGQGGRPKMPGRRQASLDRSGLLHTEKTFLADNAGIGLPLGLSGCLNFLIGGKDDVVYPGGIVAFESGAVFGIGPFEGSAAFCQRERNFGPVFFARPFVLFLIIDVESQVVEVRFRRDFVVEADISGNAIRSDFQSRTLVTTN